MAKTRRRRYYKRKGRWSANIKQIIDDKKTIAAASSFYLTTDLCKNPAQNDNTVSQQYTVKNVEFTFQLEIPYGQTGLSGVEGLICYIMYVPQGMIVTETYPLYHPEYIMASRFIGSPDYEVTDNNFIRNPLKVKSRLARRLQTGDSIIFLITGTTDNQNPSQLSINGLLRWWTKAN